MALNVRRRHRGGREKNLTPLCYSLQTGTMRGRCLISTAYRHAGEALDHNMGGASLWLERTRVTDRWDRVAEKLRADE